MTTRPSQTADPRAPGGAHEPIDVGISPRHLLAGRVAMAAFLAVCAAWTWLTLSGDLAFDPMGLLLMVVSLFLSLTYGLPLVIGRWPSFVVRIYGRRHLLDALQKVRDGLGRKRVFRASLREPRTWLYDERVQMALLLAIFFVAGLVSSLS